MIQGFESSHISRLLLLALALLLHHFLVKNLLLNNAIQCIFVRKIYFLKFCLVVTPLDVVKIRLQAQQKAMLSNKCFLYCNGLMDHLCPCLNGKGPVWAKGNGKFNGTVVRYTKL